MFHLVIQLHKLEVVTPIQPPFVYKEEFVFRDFLQRFQGKEIKVIPQEILEMLRREITPDTMVTVNLICSLLKKLKLPKYLCNARKIYQHLTGTTLFQFNSYESLLFHMFCEFQRVRKALSLDTKHLPYHFILYNLLEIVESRIGYFEWRNHVSPPERTPFIHTEIWKQCCKNLVWVSLFPFMTI